MAEPTAKDYLGTLFSFGTGAYEDTRARRLEYDRNKYDFDQLQRADSKLAEGNDAPVSVSQPADRRVETAKQIAQPDTAPQQQAPSQGTPANVTKPQDARIEAAKQIAQPSGGFVADAAKQGIPAQVAVAGIKNYADEQEYLSKANRRLADVYAAAGDSRGYAKALNAYSQSNAEMAGARATAENTQARSMINLGQMAQAANVDQRNYPRLRETAKQFGYELPERFDQRAVDSMIKQGMDTQSAGQLTQAAAHLEVQKQIAQMEQQSKEAWMKLQMAMVNAKREGGAETEVGKATDKALVKLQTEGIPKAVRESMLPEAYLNNKLNTSEGSREQLNRYAESAIMSRMLQKLQNQRRTGEPDMTANWENVTNEVVAEMSANTALRKSFSLFGEGDVVPGTPKDNATTPLPSGMSMTTVVDPSGSVTATFRDAKGGTRAQTFKNTQELNAFLGGASQAPTPQAATSNSITVTKSMPGGDRKITVTPTGRGTYTTTVEYNGKINTTEISEAQYKDWKKREGL